MQTFAAPITGPEPDRIPGILAVACIAWEGRFGGSWSALVKAESADEARARVRGVAEASGYTVGLSEPR